MLRSVRKFSSSPYAKIFLAIVILPFIFWGMGPVFQDGNQNTIVTIGKNKISKEEFYEHAKIFGNYYGTSKKAVLDLIKNNNDVLFDIDWQGTQQLSKFKELNLLKIFILPPSKEELKKRLIQRNQDKPNVVEERLKAYDSDSAHKEDYDFVVINDNLENCFKQVEQIILRRKSAN